MKFALQAFESAEPIPNIEIGGNIDRDENRFCLSYQLIGNLRDILIPKASLTPNRQDELWRETCFEFFLSLKNTSYYWEFNLSPSGHWNIYRFDDYRQGMQREAAFAELPFKVDRQSDRLILFLEIDLSKIGLADQNLEVAITAVVKQTNESVTYWALTHANSQPDFHLRESFILEC